MKKILLLLFVLLLPVNAGAVFKVYLKNGSVISDIKSYDEVNGEVTVYFKTGSMTLSKGNILRIEGSESSETEVRKEETGEKQETERVTEGTRERQEQPVKTATPEQAVSDDKTDKIDAIRPEVDKLNADIKAANEKEQSIVERINEKMSRRATYNQYHIRQLEQYLAPLRNELNDVRKRKQELLQRKSAIESEIKSIQETQ
jgi:hypothetical protein